MAVRYADDSIEIIDKTGKSVGVIQAENGAVMDYGMYSGSDLMWVLMLDDTGIEPRSQLNIHQPGKLLIAGVFDLEPTLLQAPDARAARSTSAGRGRSMCAPRATRRPPRCRSTAGRCAIPMRARTDEPAADTIGNGEGRHGATRVITGAKVTDLGCTRAART